MPMLIIHAPHKQRGKKRFDEIVRDGIGDEFAIPIADFKRLRPGDKVVVLCKDQELRAEGQVIHFTTISSGPV